MKPLDIKILLLVVGLTVTCDVIAESLSKDQYDLKEKTIAANYFADKNVCQSLTGNAKDICDAEAKGKMDYARAELEHNNKPTSKTLLHMRVVKADADYSIAMQKCDDKQGNVEEVCEKEAKAARIQQTAAAEALYKTTKADDIAIEKSYDARKDAEKDMRDANYEVAKQKCEALTGDAEDVCKKNAKIKFRR